MKAKNIPDGVRVQHEHARSLERVLQSSPPFVLLSTGDVVVFRSWERDLLDERPPGQSLYDGRGKPLRLDLKKTKCWAVDLLSTNVADSFVRRWVGPDCSPFEDPPANYALCESCEKFAHEDGGEVVVGEQEETIFCPDEIFLCSPCSDFIQVEYAPEFQLAEDLEELKEKAQRLPDTSGKAEFIEQINAAARANDWESITKMLSFVRNQVHG